jgi:hypothetical protein
VSVFTVLIVTALEIHECDLTAVSFQGAMGSGSGLWNGTPSPDDSGDCCCRSGACTCCSAVLIVKIAPAISLNAAPPGVALLDLSRLSSSERPRIDHPPRI